MEPIKFTPETRDMYDRRFGMFIHWGLYSHLEGRWKGHDRLMRTGRGDGSWTMLVNEIPLEEYSKVAYDFKPDPDWAEKLVVSAKKAGVKYFVFTAKHHDGFSMFKSKVTTYNSYDMCGRDFVKELADACRRHDLKLGLYYSHCLDWAERDAGGRNHCRPENDPTGLMAENYNYWDFPGELTKEEFAQYLERKVKPQTRELLENYGDIYIIWYDYPHDINSKQAKELYDFVKSIQPKCMVNSRVAHGFGDYSSLGDNMIPTVPTGIPTECLVTLNDTWGYLWYDDNWKTPEYTTELLVRCVTGETSLLMNVSPMKDGLLPKATEDILTFMGDWTRKYGEAVYSMQPNPLKTLVDWGYFGCRDNKLYVYIKDTTLGKYEICGLCGKLNKVTDPDGNALEFSQKGDEIKFTLSDKYGFLPVIVLEFEEKIEQAKKIIQCGNNLSLMPFFAKKRWADGHYSDVPFEYCIFAPDYNEFGLALNRACVIHEWQSPEEWVEWTATFKKTGEYKINLVFAPGDYDGGVELEVFKDGKSVLKINQDTLTESYRYELSKTGSQNKRTVYSLGKLNLEQSGEYVVRLKKHGTEKSMPVSHISFEME